MSPVLNGFFAIRSRSPLSTFSVLTASESSALTLLPVMSRNRILVVDDEHSIVEVLSYHLLREGFDVQTAGDGLEALQKCQLGASDLVVLDRMLPGIDGLEVLRRLRADRRTCDIRILMLTAMASERMRWSGSWPGPTTLCRQSRSASRCSWRKGSSRSPVVRIQPKTCQVIHHGPAADRPRQSRGRRLNTMFQMAGAEAYVRVWRLHDG